MRKTQPSSTALGTAAVRAIETERPTAERICTDPFARRFTTPLVYHLIKLFAGYGERRTGGALTFIVCRSRYFDDILQECLDCGTAQVVILGAGLDSRAYRAERRQSAVKIFEVDHPATQAGKIERVRKVFGQLPTQPTYVPVDFDAETLDKLLACGFDCSLKTLFLWEGVTYYLPAEAVDATLTWVRAHAAPGSTIVFDYQIVPEPARGSWLYVVLSRLAGERRTFAIGRGQIVAFLTRHGFIGIVEANAEHLQRRYCTGLNAGRRVGSIYAIVRAEVPT